MHGSYKFANYAESIQEAMSKKIPHNNMICNFIYIVHFLFCFFVYLKNEYILVILFSLFIFLAKFVVSYIISFS